MSTVCIMAFHASLDCRHVHAGSPVEVKPLTTPTVILVGELISTCSFFGSPDVCECQVAFELNHVLCIVCYNKSVLYFQRTREQSKVR